MVTNYYGMYQRLEDYVRKSGGDQPQRTEPVQHMLDLLQAPYNALRNYDQFLAALRQQVTPEEAEVWCVYPDYTLRTIAKTPEEVMEDVRPGLRPRLTELSQSMARKGFLLEDTAPSGQTGYIRTYFYEIASRLIYHPDGTSLAEAFLRWWIDVVDGGDSAKLRESYPEYRVLPHEGALTGDSRHGKIPMNLEIPDTREILPDIDFAETLLKKCRRYAVTDCICRVAKDMDHSRPCSFPVKDVCLMFDAVADGGIASGDAREISREEALQIIRRCRDLGMVQIISNAEHPLCVCNCCKCCCACLRSMERYEDTVGEASRYVAEAVHSDACVHCGKCQKVCPMEAVDISGAYTYVQAQRCIGCGVCVSQCPQGVLKLSKRPGAIDHIAQKNLDRVYI